MRTVRFYTDSRRYMGWEKLVKKNVLVYKSWLDSGNVIKIDGKEYRNYKELINNEKLN